MKRAATSSTHPGSMGAVRRGGDHHVAGVPQVAQRPLGHGGRGRRVGAAGDQQHRDVGGDGGVEVGGEVGAGPPRAGDLQLRGEPQEGTGLAPGVPRG